MSCLKRRILQLYGSLDSIAMSLNDENGENVEIDSICDQFEQFFAEEDSLNYLRSKEILQGTICNEHRAIIPPQDTEHQVPVGGDTLLFRAVSIDTSKNKDTRKKLNAIITIILHFCPWMIAFSKNSNEYNGLTPVHLAILKEDENLLIKMARYRDQYSERENKPSFGKDLKAEGHIFQDTAMLAGTTLGVAALKFNERIFCIVLDKFSSGLDLTNEKGDNIIHSLIKYAHGQPDILPKTVEMLCMIRDCSFFRTLSKSQTERHKAVGSELKQELQDREKREGKYQRQALKLLMMKNKERLTPLQLAAKRQQFQMFQLIMQSGVYRSRQSADYLINEEIYDITEIETLGIKEDITNTDEERFKAEYHESILQYLIHHQTKNAFRFTSFLPVKEVIRTKWRYYRWMCMVWFALHIVFMTMLTVAAILRSERIEPLPDDAKVAYRYVLTQNGFVTAVAVWGLIFGIFHLAIEVGVFYINRFQYKPGSNYLKCILRHLGTPYSNVIFRVYFVILSLLLVSDFALGVAASNGSLPEYENYCLIFALIIGWYLVMFFIQTIKAFSFFTVLIQRVFVDMVKFAIVMGLLLSAFSAAMYMIMQGAMSENENDVEEFKHFGKTMVKMLNIMLGIGDFNVFFTARSPVLAIIVFILFVLLTTILLLNALIAMMSNSCTDLMSNYGDFVATKMHSRLQKLSVILFLEGFLPYRLCKVVGVTEKKKWYENNEWDKDQQRRIWRKCVVGENKAAEEDEDNEYLSDSNAGILSFLHRFDLKKKSTRKKRHNGYAKNAVSAEKNVQAGTHQSASNLEIKTVNPENDDKIVQVGKSYTKTKKQNKTKT